MTPIRAWIVLGYVALFGGWVRAQQPEGPLAGLRQRPDLGEEERAQVRTFAAERLQRTVADDAGARAATDELRAAGEGSDGYRRVYAATCLELIGPAMPKAGLVPATRLLTVVNALNTLDALPLLLESLRDERTGVRAAAAVGLRLLRPRVVQAGRDTYQRVLDGLKEAGKKERSRDTLRSIYKALDYAELPASPDAKANVAAVVEILEARVPQYANDPIPAVGADDVGLRLAQSLLRVLDEGERRRLAGVTAGLMRQALEQYLPGEGSRNLAAVRDQQGQSSLSELRDAMERIVLVGEELLVGLLRPEKAPSVSDFLRKLDTAGIQNQWNLWVPLLQNAVGQDFALRLRPATKSEEP